MVHTLDKYIHSLFYIIHHKVVVLLFFLALFLLLHHFNLNVILVPHEAYSSQ